MNKAMEYEVIDNFPFTCYHIDRAVCFGSYDKRTVKQFAQWFQENKEDRLRMLIGCVRSDPKYADWNPDYSRESLRTLARWLYDNVEPEKFTDEEYAIMQSRMYDSGGRCLGVASEYNVTIRTKSIIVDVGIYLGEVMIHEHDWLFWEQELGGGRKSVDYGYMVIRIKFSKPYSLSFNPVEIADVHAFRVLKSKLGIQPYDPDRMVKAYDNNCKYVEQR